MPRPYRPPLSSKGPQGGRGGALRAPGSEYAAPRREGGRLRALRSLAAGRGRPTPRTVNPVAARARTCKLYRPVMGPYPKDTTTVIGAYSVPDWYESLDRLVSFGQLSMAAMADA